ncbi:MAG: hypothetical protein A2Y10_08905 [Planctomycetes bacterium GWF2_41_51]|nr:MAG: hypothetical protein A2Y10_08905 [Planctomycetes bacterium GWF2_41_51]
MERVSKFSAIVFIFNFIFAIGSVRAETSSAENKIQQVALFKNGLGFFISQIECPEEKIFSVNLEAVPSHGTFWVSYPEKVKIESLVSKEAQVEKTQDAISIAELLKANAGQAVSLFVEGNEASPINGVITHFAENRQSPEQPSPYLPSQLSYRYLPPIEQASLMIVKTDTGDIAINPQMVKKVKFASGEIKNKFSSREKTIQLEVRTASESRGEKLTLTYLAKGITWAPSYMIDISDNEKAYISAKAEVINEICDLNNVQVQFVTGYPNLQFADILSPLAKKENLAQFLQALNRGSSEFGAAAVGGALSNVMRQNVKLYEYEDKKAEMPAYGAAQAGVSAEDLFLYPLENVSLAKGEAGYFPLFTESVNYKHIYQWNISDYVQEDGQYYYNNRRQEKEPVETVWHCLRLENSTSLPWTTAPAEIVKDGFIIGQDTLDYAPPKTKTTLKITQAANVKAEQIELETARKQDALQLYGNHYDLITVDGKLSVSNFQDKAIILEITKILSGEVKSSEPESQIDSLASGVSKMNPTKKLVWTIELEPNENKQLNYVYDVYVRR